jgi:hypothetical protein
MYNPFVAIHIWYTTREALTVGAERRSVLTCAAKARKLLEQGATVNAASRDPSGKNIGGYNTYIIIYIYIYNVYIYMLHIYIYTYIYIFYDIILYLFIFYYIALH